MGELLVKDGGLAISGGAVAIAPCASCCGQVCHANGLCCGVRPYAWPFISGTQYRVGGTVSLTGRYYGFRETGVPFDLPFSFTDLLVQSTYTAPANPQPPVCNTQTVLAITQPNLTVGIIEATETWPNLGAPIRYGYLSGGQGGQLPRGGIFLSTSLFPGLQTANFRFRWGVEPGLYGTPGWSVGIGSTSYGAGSAQTGTQGTVSLHATTNGYIDGASGGGFAWRERDVLFGSGRDQTLEITSFNVTLGLECCNPPDSLPDLGPLLDALR